MKNITNSFKGLETGSIGSRLVYAYYLVLGLFFSVITLFTAYNVFAVWFKYYGLDEAHAFRSSLFLAYIFLNLIMVYGFFLCRKWLLPVLGINFLMLLVIYLYKVFQFGFTMDRQFVSLLVAGLIFSSVLLTRKFLNGILWRKFVIVVFFFVLLLTFFITKSNLIY